MTTSTPAPATAPIPEVYTWTPRFYQEDPYYSTARFICAMQSRRSGKTDLAAYKLCRLLPTSPDPLNMSCIAPTRIQSQDILFNRCERFLQPLSHHSHIEIRYSDLKIVNRRTRSVINFYGCNKPHHEQMRGREFSGLTVIDEMKDIEISTYFDIIDAAATNKECPIFLIGTPSGRTDALSTLFMSWRQKEEAGDKNYATFLLPLSITKHLPEHEIERLKATVPAHTFEREYEVNLDAKAPDVMIGTVDIQKAAQRTVGPEIYSNYPLYGGYDVGLRRDAACLSFVQGPRLHGIITLESEDPHEQCIEVARQVKKRGISKLYVDQTGPGEGPFATLSAMLRHDHCEVHGILTGESAQEKNRFHRRRSELLYRLSVWLKDSDIPADDHQLQRELGALLLEDPSDNRLQVAEKKKIRALLGHSPDRVDSVALCFADEYKLSHQQQFSISDIKSGRVKSSDFTAGELNEMLDEAGFSDDEQQQRNDHDAWINKIMGNGGDDDDYQW